MAEAVIPAIRGAAQRVGVAIGGDDHHRRAMVAAMVATAVTPTMIPTVVVAGRMAMGIAMRSPMVLGERGGGCNQAGAEEAGIEQGSKAHEELLRGAWRSRQDGPDDNT